MTNFQRPLNPSLVSANAYGLLFTEEPRDYDGIAYASSILYSDSSHIAASVVTDVCGHEPRVTHPDHHDLTSMSDSTLDAYDAALLTARSGIQAGWRLAGSLLTQEAAR